MADSDDLAFLSAELEKAVGKPLPPPKRISRWEWAPAIALVLLAAVYFLSGPESGLRRFSLFVGVGLLPGTLWRLCGRSSWNIHRIGFAIALIAYMLDNPALRPDAVSLRTIGANWKTVALGFLLSFTQPLWGMLRTHRLLIDGGVRITYFNSLKLCLSGSFFNIFLPGSTGGDAYRVYAITDGYRTRLAPAIASITLDRLLGLPSLILVVIAGMVLDYDFFLRNRKLASLIPFLALAAAACLLMIVYLVFAGKSGRRLAAGIVPAPADAKPPGRLKRMHMRISANIKRPSTLPLALFFGFMSHLACIMSCQCFAAALEVQGVPLTRYFLIVPLAMTINSIPGAPGGVGQGELAMATLLELANPAMSNTQSGVMIMLLFRLSNMAMGILGGVFYAMGKTDLTGLSSVSQGVTRVLNRGKERTTQILRRRRQEITRIMSRADEFFGGAVKEGDAPKNDDDSLRSFVMDDQSSAADLRERESLITVVRRRDDVPPRDRSGPK